MTRLGSTLLFCAATLAATAGGLPALAQETAVVARRVIYPGETIDTGSLTDVRLRRSDKVSASIVVDAAQIEGKVARRTLLPGKLIALASVREAYLVEAGAPVEVNFVQGGLRITLTGVPLQPGAAGDMIKVRNLDSGTIFSGVVLADGTIGVGGR